MSPNPNVRAWLALMAALALHVVDEAVNDFLPLYNETVLALRERILVSPPTFTFPIWLGGLIVAISIGLLVTPWIARGGKGARIVCTVLGVLMTANAIAHFAGSVALGRAMPGVWSSPFLLAAAVWTVRQGLTGDWPHGAPAT